MMLVITYFVLLAVNAGMLYWANLLFPQFVVLGTFTISLGWAIVHSMGTLALIDTFIIPFAREIEIRRKNMLTPKEWMAIYFLINAVGIWVITRFSEQFGLGISAWYVAVALAVVLDVVQGVVMMQMEKMRTKRA